METLGRRRIVDVVVGFSRALTYHRNVRFTRGVVKMKGWTAETREPEMKRRGTATKRDVRAETDNRRIVDEKRNEREEKREARARTRIYAKGGKRRSNVGRKRDDVRPRERTTTKNITFPRTDLARLNRDGPRVATAGRSILRAG